MNLLELLHDWWRGLWPAAREPLTLGQRGEEEAARFLEGLGYIVVARGERDRLGELDLVAVDGETVVFVEVKTRRTHDAGHPAEAITPIKQRRLTRLALAFLKRHDLLAYRSRFDVVALTWPHDDQPPTIEHLQGAFEPVGEGQMFS